MTPAARLACTRRRAIWLFGWPAAAVGRPLVREATVADDTAALRALFASGIGAGQPIALRGSYTVSGSLSPPAVRSRGALHIYCEGDVLIRVAPDAAPFPVLLTCHTAQPADSTITGGRLTIDLAGRCASGLVLRHDGDDGGSVRWGPVSVRDALNHDRNDINENQGLLIHGRYRDVDLQSPEVVGVNRSNGRGGACKGISISGVVGLVTLRSPVAAQVRCGPGSADADGISVFTALSAAGPYAWRRGQVRIFDASVRDCQGRSIKIQASDARIDRPAISRREVATLDVPDIDFQIGNGDLREPQFDYRRRADGSSALHPAFYPVSMQQQCTDRPMAARITGGVLRTEIALPRLLYITVGAAARDGITEVDGLRCNPGASGEAPPGFRRAFVEFSGGQVGASAGRTAIAVRRVQVALRQAPLIGYTEASSAAAAQVAVALRDNSNLLPTTAPLLAPVSGPPMPGWRRLDTQGNRGFRQR